MGIRASSATVSPSDIHAFAWPRADQFCVYDELGDLSDPGVRRALFLTEYKPPHKLSLGHIYEGLEEMSLEEVLVRKDSDGQKELCRRLLAVVITPLFSYMILVGHELGCIRTGEASIFVRASEDLKTAYYFLSVPKNDEGNRQGGSLDALRSHQACILSQIFFVVDSRPTCARDRAWRRHD
jgi:hypothetical protein